LKLFTLNRMADFASIRFLSGRPLLRELSADRLNSILTEIKRNKPKGERGITVRQDGNQTWIGLAASLPQGGSAAPSSSHPFQVKIKIIDEAYYWGIQVDSRAYTSISPFDQGNVIGLLTTGEDNDSGWAAIDTSSEDDYIYLEWDEENAEAKIASIGNDGLFDPAVISVTSAGAWLELEVDTPLNNFKFARKIIAKAEEGENGPIVTQYTKQHQLLQNICYAGTPARYWFDFTKGLAPLPT